MSCVPKREASIRWAKTIVFAVFLAVAAPLFTGVGQAAVIDDRAGGAIYWGGKYVKIKPSAYADVIGKRTEIDQMEVIMENDFMTVKITGRYFFNYVHNIKRTRDAIPGDLYISSQGWKVSGTPPYAKDIFETSEGWDYVVSLEKKKVYMLKFSDIIMTSALPHSSRYRAHQAWRGGYGDAVDDAVVSLTDTGLTFIFSVRNMRLQSEIGLHWTMKCGNDIVEGAALIPPIAMISETPAVDIVDADPAEPISFEELIPIPAEPLIEPVPGASENLKMVWVPPGALFPVFVSDDDEPFVPPPPDDHKVPEPLTALLILAGLSVIVIGKLLVSRAGL